MKFWRNLGLLVKGLINSKPAVEVAKAARDPRISEPVWMMIRSIKQNPKRWKVVLNLPDYRDMALRGHRPRSYMQVGGMVGYPVHGYVLDTITGEKYGGMVYADLTDMPLSFKKEPFQIFVMTVSNSPDWMTNDEASALVYALTQEYGARLAKVKKRQTDRDIKAQRRREEARQHHIAEERERLIKVYKEGSV